MTPECPAGIEPASVSPEGQRPQTPFYYTVYYLISIIFLLRTNFEQVVVIFIIIPDSKSP